MHRNAINVLMTVGLFLLLGVSELNASWTSHRQNQEGTASIEYKGDFLSTEWYYFFKHNLRYKPGLAVWSSPALAIVKNTPMVFIGGHSQTLLALDLVKKKVRWLKITNGEIGAAPAVVEVEHEPCVLFTSADRSIYAYHADTGEKRWITELIPPRDTLGDANLSSPLVHQGMVYVASFCYDKSLPRNRQWSVLSCLSAQNGRIIWQKEIVPGYTTSPVGFELDSHFYIVITSRKGAVQCFAVDQDGLQLVWKYQMPHEIYGSPVVEKDVEDPYLFLGSKFGNLTALSAKTGKKVWQHMAGNWIDNTACIGTMKNQKVVFVGSHDYKLYAFETRSGRLLWATPLGGEVYSAPAFFEMDQHPYVAVACLDDRVYVVRADTGAFYAAFFAGEPIWDKVPKGETLMGSPAVLQVENPIIIHGSYSGTVCAFPVRGKSLFRDQARSFKALWLSLPVLLVLFLGIILPLIIKFDAKSRLSE